MAVIYTSGILWMIELIREEDSQLSRTKENITKTK